MRGGRNGCPRGARQRHDGEADDDDDHEDAVLGDAARERGRLARREIDFATFTASQRDAWDAIRPAGPAIEAEVLRALHDQLPTESAVAAARAATARLRCRR
jgi:hypothetical protein